MNTPTDEVAKFIEKSAFHGTLPPLNWNVHSQNGVGGNNIRMAMKSAERAWALQ